MNEAQITRLDSSAQTSCAYNSYTTSAISTDARRYVVLPADEMPGLEYKRDREIFYF